VHQVFWARKTWEVRAFDMNYGVALSSSPVFR